MTVKTLWVIALSLTVCASAAALPPANTNPNSPTAKWFKGAWTPDCELCCDVSDGRFVAARPDATSPYGWAVELHPGVWVPVPGDVRATKCSTYGALGGKPEGPYDPDPAGRAVIWVFPTEDHIRCFSPPEAGG